jgi:type II secretory pathway predicted ATPase ExeA
MMDAGDTTAAAQAGAGTGPESEKASARRGGRKVRTSAVLPAAPPAEAAPSTDGPRAAPRKKGAKAGAASKGTRAAGSAPSVGTPASEKVPRPAAGVALPVKAGRAEASALRRRAALPPGAEPGEEAGSKAAASRRLTPTMTMASSKASTGGEAPVPTCMYQAFFGLRRAPFSIAPDPRAMFMSERHREALAHLLYGVQGGSGGFVLLTGEIGAGKTTVSRCLLEQMPQDVRVAWILNPRQNADELLASICEEFGVKVAPAEPGRAAVPALDPPSGPAGSVTPSAALGAEEADAASSPVSALGLPAMASSAAAAAEPVLPGHSIDAAHEATWPDRVEPPMRRTTKRYVDALARFLLQSQARGRHCVLIVDEAQSLGADVLEQLRLLTNLETHERKLLQIVLIGQPELRTLLANPGMEQLSQRVVARYHLGPLSEEETGRYIQHRMEYAGLAGVVPFDAEARRRIYRLTRGVPRQVNRVCDRALLGAYGQRTAVVNATMVQKAWAEVTGRDDDAGGGAGRVWPADLRVRAPLVAGSLAALGVVAAAFWWWIKR